MAAAAECPEVIEFTKRLSELKKLENKAQNAVSVCIFVCLYPERCCLLKKKHHHDNDGLYHCILDEVHQGR